MEAFEPAMRSLLPHRRSAVHAETLLMLCLADGVLEVLEWAREGTGADPGASLWLASLRWYRLVAGEFPENAPQPQPRPADFALGRIKEAGALDIVPGSAEESLAGLDSAEMNLLPRRGRTGMPPGEELDRAAVDSAALSNPVLARVIPIGLAPYVELEMKQDWAAQAVFLTHQDPELVAAARQVVAELHSAGGTDAKDPTNIKIAHLNSPGISYIAGTNGEEGSAGGQNELLTVVVEDLARRWRTATSQA